MDDNGACMFHLYARCDYKNALYIHEYREHVATDPEKLLRAVYFFLWPLLYKNQSEASACMAAITA